MLGSSSRAAAAASIPSISIPSSGSSVPGRPWRHSHSTKEVVPHYQPDSAGLQVIFAPSSYAHKYRNDALPALPGEGRSGKRVCGLRRATFWLIVALAGAALLAVAVGTGLSLGLGRVPDENPKTTTNAENNSTSPPPSPPPSIPSTTMSSSRTTNSTPTPTPTPPVSSKNGTSIVDCPSANNTAVQPSPSGSNLAYLILCNVEIRPNSPSKFIQLTTILPTLQGCLDLCDSLNEYQQRTDVSAAWNEVRGDDEIDVPEEDKPKGTCECFGGTDQEVVPSLGKSVALPRLASGGRSL
ncbi:hypothetical protein B0H63DRAFT_218758 [Podospora didyma]|uniref:Uncharacterized protein n=1 Tax=Podospora didyma TaxID=330526 RepID=A0AAE0KJ11_9PEZI|nr:hypothetical protein B0H63DRAFT_218758 [Podospora didyma]